MAEMYDTMMTPKVEELMDAAGSKFGLCTLASTRAREINSYFGQLGDGLGTKIPPQVTSVARKPLSIAFEEIAAAKIVPIRPEPVAEGDEASDDDAA
ncbi:MAG: DNA-directed RNA polymerase subunit omega [Acidimicrobiales bacterium]|jgi:DNA-directed RNA polymerase subunit omega